MAKIQSAMDRLFKNVFVCKRCSTKIRADPKKIIEKKVRCRKCGGKNFRPKRKK
jgi:ribosomal protein L40E